MKRVGAEPSVEGRAGRGGSRVVTIGKDHHWKKLIRSSLGRMIILAFNLQDYEINVRDQCAHC